VKAPPTVAFFVWMAALGKILTLDNLQKRNIMVEWCYICKQCGKSTYHLLLYFEVEHELQNMFFQLFGVNWAKGE
jgi:hypothetical protein